MTERRNLRPHGDVLQTIGWTPLATLGDHLRGEVPAVLVEEDRVVGVRTRYDILHPLLGV